ncbi:MAG: hypothetical protein R2834_11785 [Rhodothermales bacterium]
MKSMFRCSAGVIMLACYALFSTGCDAEDPDEGTLKAIAFAPGGTLRYQTTLTTTVTGFDGVVRSTSSDIDTFAVNVSPTSEDIPGIPNTLQLDLFDPAEPALRDAVWYIQNDSQLVEVAYRNGETGAPALGIKRSPAFERFVTAWRTVEGRVAGTPGDIQIRADPRVVVTFPLEIGSRWTSFTDPWLQVREALREEPLDVPAGTFDCVVVETITMEDNPENGHFTDHVTSAGLVQRVYQYDSDARDAENQLIGTLFFETRFVLIGRDR